MKREKNSNDKDSRNKHLDHLKSAIGFGFIAVVMVYVAYRYYDFAIIPKGQNLEGKSTVIVIFLFIISVCAVFHHIRMYFKDRNK